MKLELFDVITNSAIGKPRSPMPSSCKIGVEAVMKSWSKMSKGTVVECSMGRWTGTYEFPTGDFNGKNMEKW